MANTLKEHILAAIDDLEPEAYGVPIRKSVEETMGRFVSTGAVHTALDELEQTGLVRSEMGEATAERGWRRKRYYFLTTDGYRALRAVPNPGGFSALIPEGGWQ